MNLMDPQMTAMYYPVPLMLPVGQFQPYPFAYSNFFMFPTTAATPYSEGLISPPVSYSIPDSNQLSTPASAPAQVPNDEMVRAFENHTVSSFSASPQVRNDIQQSVTGSNNTVDNDTVSEYQYSQIMEPNPMDPQMSTMYYPISPVGQVQPYPVASPNFFMPLPTTTATPYSEGLISPPISYSIPDSNQLSTTASAPAQVPNDEMVRAFENHTVSSFSASPQVRNDIQQSVTGSNNTVDNDTVSEYQYSQITESNPMDPQMTTMYYPISPVGQVQPYPVASPNFFMPFLTTTATPYSEGLISPPISYSIPDSNQPSTPDSALSQVSNDEMTKAFENHTVSSLSASPQVRNDIQQSITDSNNTIDNDNVGEYLAIYGQITELKVFTVCSSLITCTKM